MVTLRKICVALTALFISTTASAYRLEKINYGDFSNWVTRHITESKVIGGARKTVYAIGPTRTINGNVAYTNSGGSPWASSNVYAKVSGVVKASNTVARIPPLARLAYRSGQSGQ